MKQGYVENYWNGYVLSRTDLETTNCFKRTMVLYYSTLIICAFGTKGVLLGYFTTSLGKRFAHKAHRGHKRSSGGKLYASSIQTSIAISCCARSKRQRSEKTRYESKLYAVVIGIANYPKVRERLSSRGGETVLTTYGSTA